MVRMEQVLRLLVVQTNRIGGSGKKIEQVKESENILKQIIKNFPKNDYSKYARSLLIDGK